MKRSTTTWALLSALTLGCNEAPTTVAPDAASDASAPDVSAPDVGANDVGANDVGANDVATRDVAAPDIATSDVTTRDVTAIDAPPDVSAPRDVTATDTPAPRDVPTTDTPAPRDVTATDTPAPTDASVAATPWVMGYYPGYQRDLYPPESIDFTAITHLAVGAVLPRADGTLDRAFYLDATRGPAFARDLATRAHAAGRRAILMVGGAGTHDGWVGAASPAHRAAFVTNLLAAMRELGYDGLDLDWEPIEAADQAPLLALASALRAAAPTMVLTIPVNFVNANFPTVGSFYGTLSAQFDQVNVMTYGMAGAWDGWQSWHSSALRGEGASTPSSVESSVNAYLAAGVAASRIGIGMGFYGSCWSSPVTAPRQALRGATISADDNVMSFTNIMAGYFSAGAYHFDTDASAPYLSFDAPHGAQRCTFVSYEDAASIAEKGRYVRDHHLGGAIIWTINEGHLSTAPAGMRDPLLSAVRAAFLSP